MDHGVIEKCRAELQSQLDELQAGAERTVVDMTSVEEENFPDPTDRASLESNRNFTLRLRDRDRKLVAKIQEAIKRIEGGTFGDLRRVRRGDRGEAADRQAGHLPVHRLQDRRRGGRGQVGVLSEASTDFHPPPEAAA